MFTVKEGMGNCPGVGVGMDGSWAAGDLSRAAELGSRELSLSRMDLGLVSAAFILPH